jgi:hypothetical protein
MCHVCASNKIRFKRTMLAHIFFDKHVSVKGVSAATWGMVVEQDQRQANYVYLQ